MTPREADGIFSLIMGVILTSLAVAQVVFERFTVRTHHKLTRMRSRSRINSSALQSEIDRRSVPKLQYRARRVALAAAVFFLLRGVRAFGHNRVTFITFDVSSTLCTALLMCWAFLLLYNFTYVIHRAIGEHVPAWARRFLEISAGVTVCLPVLTVATKAVLDRSWVEGISFGYIAVIMVVWCAVQWFFLKKVTRLLNAADYARQTGPAVASVSQSQAQAPPMSPRSRSASAKQQRKGAERLARFHRLLVFTTIALTVIVPMAVFMSYVLTSDTNKRYFEDDDEGHISSNVFGFAQALFIMAYLHHNWLKPRCSEEDPDAMDLERMDDRRSSSARTLSRTNSTNDIV